MPHAIIRGENGRCHEVDFGDAPVRAEIYASEETVEIFIEADSETLPEEASAVCPTQHSPSPLQRSHRRSRATGREPSSFMLDVMTDHAPQKVGLGMRHFHSCKRQIIVGFR
jgi:hypothetical protein